jgi:hypothetical protein
MMTPSIYFKDLESRVEFLRKNFLNFDDIESPQPENQDKLKSFKLLVHAEVESYLENIVNDMISINKKQWKKKKITPSLYYLILFSSAKFGGEKKIADLSVKKRIDNNIASFEALISQNNGIKEKNLMKLFIPLGIDFQSLDQSWISTIDSYGSSRGDIAHKSYSVQVQLDKTSEGKNVTIILEGIKELDIKVQKLRNLRKRPF